MEMDDGQPNLAGRQLAAKARTVPIASCQCQRQNPDSSACTDQSGLSNKTNMATGSSCPLRLLIGAHDCTYATTIKKGP